MEIISTIIMWIFISFALTAAVGLLTWGVVTTYVKIARKSGNARGAVERRIDVVSYTPLMGIAAVAFFAWTGLFEWEIFYNFLMYGAVWFLLLTPVYFRQQR